jgi:hypothetical protein
LGKVGGHIRIVGSQITSFGDPVTFTNLVSTAAGSLRGTVTFKLGRFSFGKVALWSATATFTTVPSQLKGGADSITATYNGDTNHAVSSSAVLAQMLNKAITLTTY